MTRPSAVEVAPATVVPPRRPRRDPAVVATVAVVVTAVIVGVWWAGSFGNSAPVDEVRFEVWDQHGDQALHTLDVEIGTTFTLEHTHSVTERLVVETFSVQEGPFVAIEELWFDQPGPNLPTDSEPLGDGYTTFLDEDGAYRVVHHSYPIGSVPLLVGSAGVDHVLNFADGARISLLDVADAGTAVELRVR